MNEYGYGPHRLIYRRATGSSPPKGMDLDHLCRQRDCLNPDHMEPVPHRVNLLRGDTAYARGVTATHCQRGHEFDLLNTLWTPDGRRQCRTCARARYLKHRAG